MPRIRRISHVEVIMIQNFWICINAVIPLMIYLIIGMLVKRVGLINDDEVHRFNRLVFIVLFPPMMFENLYGAKLSTALNPRLIVFALVFILSYIALSIPVVQKLEKKPETRGAMIQAMYRSNFVLMGLPIAINICGAGNVSKTAILITIIVPTYNVLAVIILEYYRGGRASISKMLRKIVTNPIILGAVAAGIVISFNITVPKSIGRVVYSLSECTTPMAMMLLGASFNIKSVKSGRRNLSINNCQANSTPSNWTTYSDAARLQRCRVRVADSYDGGALLSVIIYNGRVYGKRWRACRQCSNIHDRDFHNNYIWLAISVQEYGNVLKSGYIGNKQHAGLCINFTHY